MAFRRKFAAIASLKPDLLIISECESPEYLQEKQADLPWPNHVWIGDNRTKGLSIFAREGITLALLPSFRPRLRFIAPVSVQTETGSFNLYGVWTQGHKTPSKSYVAHTLKALGTFGKALTPDCIWAGDFNSNPVFKHSGARHLEMVNKLNKHGLSSVYHDRFCENQGEETQPSFYLHRDLAKPYHLDYLFCRPDRLADMQIGQPEKWLGQSDHMPLIVDLHN